MEIFKEINPSLTNDELAIEQQKTEDQHDALKKDYDDIQERIEILDSCIQKYEREINALNHIYGLIEEDFEQKVQICFKKAVDACSGRNLMMIATVLAAGFGIAVAPSFLIAAGIGAGLSFALHYHYKERSKQLKTYITVMRTMNDNQVASKEEIDQAIKQKKKDKEGLLSDMDELKHHQEILFDQLIDCNFRSAEMKAEQEIRHMKTQNPSLYKSLSLEFK